MIDAGIVKQQSSVASVMLNMDNLIGDMNMLAERVDYLTHSLTGRSASRTPTTSALGEDVQPPISAIEFLELKVKNIEYAYKNLLHNTGLLEIGITGREFPGREEAEEVSYKRATISSR